MGFLTGLLGGGKAKVTQPTVASGLQLQSAVQGTPVQLVYGATRISPNLIWYGDFIATANQSAPASGGGKGGVGGGGGGKGGGGSTSYTYSTAVAMALCEGPITGIGNCYVDKNTVSLASLNLSLFTGNYSQSPWPYLSTNHPSQALNYRGIAYVAASSYSLGNSPQLPNHNFEVQGILYASAPNGQDADPSQVLSDFLTNSVYGSGLPAARLASLTVWKAYCLANGLWISPSYNMQSSASTIVDDLALATNSAVVWTSGQLNMIPYGDQSITANGYTYTAPSAPLYDLTDDDFMKNTGSAGSSSSNSDPIQLVRKRPADKINNIKIEVLDRNNAYNPAIIESKDQALIDLYGLRASGSKQLHLFCDLNAAQLSASLQLQRQQVCNQYAFTLDQRYIVLDPMDIVTLTDANLGLNKQWVRIQEITENDTGTLNFLAEEYLDGNGSAPLYSYQSNIGFNANYNSVAGNANPPIIFEPPTQITTTGLEVWLSTSGGSNWGGCDVFISADGSTYKNAGRITGSSRQGVLTNTLPSGSDPDTTDTLSVSLSMSSGQLLSGTQNDADNFHTLCYVAGELISYETATLTSAFNYNLTYLRRGAYGTTISSHANGSNFARLDAGIFTYPYNKTNIGQTLYIKLLSFNIYGGGEQSLADVIAYTHTLTGPPLPAQVQNFQVSQSGNSVVFSWMDNTPDNDLKGYDIAYGTVGSSWGNKLLLTEAHRGTEMTNADVPPGPWEFSIRAHDIADNLGTESIIDFTVSNPNSLILNAVQEPSWPGTCSGFIVHPSGVLVPNSTTLANATSDFTIFDNFVVNPVSTASYTAPTQDVGYNSNLRVYDKQASALGPGQSGAIATLGFSIDTWLSGASDPNSYTSWTLAYVNFRYLNGRLTYSSISAGNVSYITDFTILADVAPSVQESGSLTIAPGGTTLTFPNPYHSAPYVTATVISSSGLYASVESITATTCIIHVWNSSGSDVGGNVNWQSTGT